MLVDLWILIVLIIAASPCLILVALCIIYILVESIFFLIDEFKQRKEAKKNESKRPN